MSYFSFMDKVLLFNLVALFSGSWYKLTNGNAIMVDIKHSGELKEPLCMKAGNISEIDLNFNKSKTCRVKK